MRTVEEAVSDASFLIRYAIDLVDGPPGVASHLTAAVVQLRGATALLKLNEKD